MPKLNRPGHHRDGSVQNAITYLCISPDLHSCSKDALYGSEGLVLPRSNRKIETKPGTGRMVRSVPGFLRPKARWNG
jgi:hypothetical protein